VHETGQGTTLSGLVVVEAGEGVAPAYAGRLLLDQGATVRRAERPGGNPLRRWSAATPDTLGSGALYSFLDDGKAEFHGDLTGTDVVIAGPDADDLLGAAWRTTIPNDCVVVSVSPFGDSGALSGLPATEFTLQAWCGSMSACRTPSTPPVQMGAGPGAWATGATAALAALAARSVGGGVAVDVAALEVMAVCLTNYPTLYAQFTGRTASISRGGDWPSVVECKDGWIGLCLFTPQQWADFAAMIGRADLAEDERLNSMAGRARHRELAESVIRPWLAEHTAAEIHELGMLLRVPVALIGNGRSVLEMEHFEARGSFVENAAGFRHPRSPIRVTPGPTNAPARREPARTARPLQGVTVVDLTAFWAGPYASHLLATLGADVIKVESPHRPDGMRLATTASPAEPNWMELSPTFHAVNPGKRSVSIDFSTPSGRELILKLIERADVLVENFTPRVLANAGLDPDTLWSRRADLVVVRMPAFGLDGPWRDLPGFAQTIEQVSGVGWLTGTPDGDPVVRTSVDPIAGIHAAFATLAALERRRRTGAGALVEVTMAEVGLVLASEAIVTWSADGVLLDRDGNRGRCGVPQGIYPCAGHGPDAERWVALSVQTDKQWRSLVEVLGRPAWAIDPSLEGRAGRRDRHDELDAQLAVWFAARDRDDAVAALLAAGVPAAPVWNHSLQGELPQLVERGFFQPVEHQVAGTVSCPGIGMTSPDIDLTFRGAAPRVGEHTREVLRTVLRLDDDDLATLAAEGAIGAVMEANP
jgi:crotonobetainyl-CoA:carnitine CoA-transferase CaiB-like acyl-CoA transferase